MYISTHLSAYFIIKIKNEIEYYCPCYQLERVCVKAAGTRIQNCAKTNNIVLKISTHQNVLAEIGIRSANVSIIIKSTQTL